MDPDDGIMSQGSSTDPQTPCRTYINFFNSKPVLSAKNLPATFIPEINSFNISELIREYFFYLDQNPRLYSEVKKKARFLFGDPSLEPYGYCNEQHGERAICALGEVLEEFRSGRTEKVSEVHDTMLYSFKRYLHYWSWMSSKSSNSFENRMALEIFSLKEALIFEPEGEKIRHFRIIMENIINDNKSFLELAKDFFFVSFRMKLTLKYYFRFPGSIQ